VLIPEFPAGWRASNYRQALTMNEDHKIKIKQHWGKLPAGFKIG
jgi:hypothetical protein